MYILHKNDKKVSETFELMIAKNHDYGEAWRDMEVISLTDLIIQKIFRMKSINNNDGIRISCEGIESNFQVAFMAPTEILAKQHYESAINLFDKRVRSQFFLQK